MTLSQKIWNVNELEVVGDHIYANQFLSDKIYKINKKSGLVEKTWDFKELKGIQKKLMSTQRGYDWGNAVLNGIAYRKESDTFFLTGKMWDVVFEVKLLD